ncbi:hypothetical protein GPECTOR_106g126 [Gonium pectorale]|uniref:Ion transport domain-containing protein n=1 Tax=Gonium pectorale TaxID=33097 RepID=A0A150FZL3_GONPE|nr:hypothetical protein GPECTOR_106g126 [Gonium pectorale]|eukprot:KXZ43032.1 hypothetical protein GPECTOR_106g126 [Gonium pectorale]
MGAAVNDAREQLHALRLHLEGVGDDEQQPEEQGWLPRAFRAIKHRISAVWQKIAHAYRERLDADDRSWWLFEQRHPLRSFCRRVSGAAWFGRLVLTLVLASCVVMAMDDPGCTDACKQQAVLSKASLVLDVFFLAAFTLEITIKSVANNFAFGPGAYLKSGWNWIDFLATASGYLRYLPIGDSGGLSGIRAMRALRPLRALTAVPGLKMLVETLLAAVPLLVDVIFLLTWVFFVFGIVALNLFMGKLQKRCVLLVGGDETQPLAPSALAAPAAPPGLPTAASGYGNDTAWPWEFVPGLDNAPCASGSAGLFKCPQGSVCLDVNLNPNFGYTSFDNFGAAAFCIFQMLTLDAWTGDLLHPLMDAVGPALPVIYFTLLVLFGAFFAMQLLVAILSSKFAQLSALRPKKKRRRPNRRRMHTPPDTTDEEADVPDPDAPNAVSRRRRPPPRLTRLRRWWRRSWFHLHRKYLVRLREKDLPPWRLVFWNVTYSVWFNNLMTAFILANTVTLALEHQGMSSGFQSALENVNLVLTGGFLLEFLIKQVGVGAVGYLRDPWNLLDGAIVVLSVVELGLTYGPAAGGGGGGDGGDGGGGGSGTNTQALRTFRMLRILRSLKLMARVEALRKLMRMVLRVARPSGLH